MFINFHKSIQAFVYFLSANACEILATKMNEKLDKKNDLRQRAIATIAKWLLSEALKLT